MVDRLTKEARGERRIDRFVRSVYSGTTVVGGAVVGWSAAWAFVAAFLYGTGYDERWGMPPVLAGPWILWIGVPAAALGLPAAVMKGARATERWRDFSVAVRSAFVAGMLGALGIVAAHAGAVIPRAF